jgi:hypothetical protein
MHRPNVFRSQGRARCSGKESPELSKKLRRIAQLLSQVRDERHLARQCDYGPRRGRLKSTKGIATLIFRNLPGTKYRESKGSNKKNSNERVTGMICTFPIA